MNYYLVFDVETSGLEVGYHEIIQLGACLYDEKWQLLGKYLSNVYPEYPDRFSISSSKVHDLSLHDLDEAPQIHEVIEQFEEWAMKLIGGRQPSRQLLRNVMLCGQSVTTDINFLKQAYKDQHLNWDFSNRVLDLFVLSNYYFTILRANGLRSPKSLSLGAVAEYFGFERENETHNALEDALLTAKCLKIMMLHAKKFTVEEEDLEFDPEDI
jgi:DNA polymerase-3 subunit epsilon